MVGHRPGSDLIRCSQCGESFTATAWLLHAHNPVQSSCEMPACSRKAVGFCEVCSPPTPRGWQSIAGGMQLCGEHLLEHRRQGHAVRIVDGSVCRVCGGEGRVLSQGADRETPEGRWMRCPHCQGSGYDPSLRDRASRRPPSAGPSPTVVRAETDAAQARAERIRAVDEIAAAEEARSEADNARAERLRVVAERIAADKAAAEEAERAAAEEQARQEAERAAAEEQARREAERAAAEERARREAERAAAEERARRERAAAWEQARREAERAAAEEQAQREREMAQCRNVGRLIAVLLLIGAAGGAYWFISQQQGGAPPPPANVAEFGATPTLTPTPTPAPPSTPTSQPDVTASLRALYNATDGPNWVENANCSATGRLASGTALPSMTPDGSWDSTSA